MIGFISRFRKCFRTDWWRDRCGCCLGDRDNGTFSDFSPRYGTKELNPQVLKHTRGSPKKEGVENHSFQTEIVNESNPKEREPTETEAPTIHIYPPPPPDYSSLDISTYPDPVIHYAPGYSERLNPPFRTGELRTKVVKRPSTTSDYVSDAESEYCHPLARKATGGRYSTRKSGEKKRHRRKMHHHARPRGGSTRSYTHSSSLASRNQLQTHKMRKYATGSLTNLNALEPRRPVSRRHSLDVTTSRRETSSDKGATKIRMSMQLSVKRKRSSSDAHALKQDDQTTIAVKSKSALPKSDNFSHIPNAMPSQQINPDLNLSLQKSSSFNPTPHKARQLVRNETILELPIRLCYGENRPTSAHAPGKLTSDSARRVQGVAKKSRHQKPPRSQIIKDNKKDNEPRGRISRSEKWLYGYASLPANLSNDALQRAGLTRESFMESLENLDLEKICRPVPSITEDQQQKSPRKSVVEKTTPGDEREILKNTYKLENYNIVSTDL